MSRILINRERVYLESFKLSSYDLALTNHRTVSVIRKNSELFEEFFGGNTRSRIDSELHFVDFFVNFLHKMNDKVNELVLVHLFGVEVGHEKTDVVALKRANGKH